MSSIEQQSCFYAAVGFVASAFSCPQLWAGWKREKLFWLRLGGISILVLGLPAVVGEWAGEAMSDVSRAALFALVPFIVVAVAMGSELLSADEPGVRRFFVPALAGLGGVLLLLSVRLSDVSAGANDGRCSCCGNRSGRLCERVDLSVASGIRDDGGAGYCVSLECGVLRSLPLRRPTFGWKLERDFVPRLHSFAVQPGGVAFAGLALARDATGASCCAVSGCSSVYSAGGPCGLASSYDGANGSGVGFAGRLCWLHPLFERRGP